MRHPATRRTTTAPEQRHPVTAASGEIPRIRRLRHRARRRPGLHRRRRDIVHKHHPPRRQQRFDLRRCQRVEHLPQRLMEQDRVAAAAHGGQGGHHDLARHPRRRHNAGDLLQVGARHRHLLPDRPCGVVVPIQQPPQLRAHQPHRPGVIGNHHHPARFQTGSQPRQQPRPRHRRHDIQRADHIDDIEPPQRRQVERGGIAVLDAPALAECRPARPRLATGMLRGIDTNHPPGTLPRRVEQLRPGATADIQHVQHRPR